MTYQKPINPQRFDEPVYERLQPKKKTALPPKKQNEQRGNRRRPASKKPGPATRSRAGALNRSK